MIESDKNQFSAVLIRKDQKVSGIKDASGVVVDL